MGDKISFLVISYNGLQNTDKCIASLLKHEKDNEILLLDNGSSERIYSKMKEKYFRSSLKAFRSEINLGVAGGRNSLLKKVCGDICVFVDNDVEMQGSVSEKIISNLSDPSIGIYGKTGVLLSTDLRPFVVSDKKVDVVTGFFQCFRTELIEKIGAIDENYEIYGYEDMDFCLRAKKAGYKIIADNSLPVIHHEHGSFSALKNIDEISEKNREYFFHKWNKDIGLLEVEREKINRLTCLNCTEVWER